MIKLIIFDLWKTLAYRDIPEERTITMQNAMHSTIPHSEFVKLFESSLQTKKWDSKMDAYTHLCKVMWLPVTEERVEILLSIAEHSEKRAKAYTHTIPMLKQLKKIWYKTGIISNNWNFALDWVKRKTSILDYIDYPLFSFEVGVIKPDLKIFEKMLEISWCKPEETIMIWDKMWDDVLPPRKLGMNSCLYENYEQLKKDLLDFGIVLQ